MDDIRIVNVRGTRYSIASQANENIGEIEMGDTATQVWNVDDLFINSEGKLCQATQAIAIGDSLVIDTNIEYKIVSDILEELRTNKQNKTDNNLTTTNKTVTGAINELKTSFSQALTSLKATAIAQAVGATGNTFASVIATLATIINRGKVTPAGLNPGGSYTIPAGYHNGQGKVTANSMTGTYTITSNGTHDMGATNTIRYVEVNADVKHQCTPYQLITQDTYRHCIVGLLVDGVSVGAKEVGTYGSQQNGQFNGDTYTV